MNVSKVTFVTSWFSIYNENEDSGDKKTPEWRKEQFKNLLSTGIQICIYVSPEYYDQVIELSQQYNNLKIMGVLQVKDTMAYKCCDGLELTLPTHRAEKKDTFEYMIVINSKFEFLADAAEKNPWNSTHFLWIDFNITHVFRKLPQSLYFLKFLSTRTYVDNLFAISGYKDKKFKGENLYEILEQVYWRYCGGFMIVDKKLTRGLCDLYYTSFREFLLEHKRIVWEVNLWAWLEKYRDWTPTCFEADHNDSIISIPCRFSTFCINDALQKQEYDYPKYFHNEVEYLPSSAAYVYYQGKHILNTRLVNYSYCLKQGRYLIRDYFGILHTKNIRSYLDPDTFIPICYGEMLDDTVGLPSVDRFSHGLEDIRLFVYLDKIHFICTNVNYSPNGRNRMMIGEYDPETLRYNNCRVLQPFHDSWCEKNWVPLVKDNELYMIYCWSPMKICKINSDDQLEVVRTFEPLLPYFHKVRGSTTFVENLGSLLGLVHFSDDTHPRQYFHMFVRLHKDTFEPIAYSDPFCFQHYGVEFCVGFTIRDNKYVFWLSKRDNEAIMVTIDQHLVPTFII
jgi:hypothetical protein